MKINTEYGPASNLLIEQPGVPPSDIVYHVTQAPAYGYLELDPPLATTSNEIDRLGSGSDPGSVGWFDQAAINEERLHYVQAGGQNQTQDYFLLDVTNGILWIRGLQVNIIIVPEHIYLSSGDKN
ncbi:uncharacterized protein LOC108253503 [Diaphorina citri]|uniref:Uncharacterized protein LOC108253503 n=1 Tax=Diaphorina citri TaxID=121845 RepID=A0A3Q0JAQ2_DIACI|nr:uncharacterized protein LOC108253503 [Diaphorina citri]